MGHAGYEMPRVLVLATEPRNDRTAQELGVFPSRKNKLEIVPARRSVSAILLLSIGAESSSIIGVLHPDPVRPFDPETLANVHFARLRQWPLEIGGRFGVEWVGAAPSATTLFNFPVKLEDFDLKA